MMPYACMSEDLITVVIGLGFPTPEIALAAAGAHLASFDQDGWAWDREALSKLHHSILSELVASLKQAAGLQ
jgi:hypothetical protein